MISTQDAATKDFFIFRFPVQTRKGIKDADGAGEEFAAVSAADMAAATGKVCAEDDALSFETVSFLKLESEEDTWLAMSRLAESFDAIAVMSSASRFRYMAT